MSTTETSAELPQQTPPPAIIAEETIYWRRKRSLQDFFMDNHGKHSDLITKSAVSYLSTNGVIRSLGQALCYLISSNYYRILLIVWLLTVGLHLLLYLIKPSLPYLAVVNTLECAWYLGSNHSSAYYRAVPFALPPQPMKPNEYFGPLTNTATLLLKRWQPPEPIHGLPRCILAHRSSECQLIGGVHKCNVHASPRFCPHFHVVRYRQLQKSGKPQPLPLPVVPTSAPQPQPVVPTSAPNSSGNVEYIRLPEADPLDGVPAEPAVSEDCLFLSIGRPRDYSTGYPVIVFVTGSGYVSETTRSLGQDSLLHSDDGLPDALRAVVVRIGYRMGFHGIFQPAGVNSSVLNYGLPDLLRGLEYLQQVVKDFGGDVNRITLVGHGSGAGMAMAVLHTQRRTGKKLVSAAWLSSGPSRIPNSAPALLSALESIHANRWTNISQLRLKCPVDDVIECRKEMEAMDEGRLLSYLTAKEDVYKAWTRTGYLDDWSLSLSNLIRQGTVSVAGNIVTPEAPLEWLAPDGVTLTASPTEDSPSGLGAWADVPVVFGNVADHYEGFPGFRVQDNWQKVWKEVLTTLEMMDIAGNPNKLIARLKKPDMSQGDAQGILTAVRVGTLLRFICPYRYLAKALAKSSNRRSPVYHYVQRYRLKYAAKFLELGDSSMHNGAFYGLDLLLMLGTAPRAAESWDRRDQAMMQHLQAALSTFASSGRPPSSWYTVDSGYTVMAQTDGLLQSMPSDDAITYCDSVQYNTFPHLMGIV